MTDIPPHVNDSNPLNPSDRRVHDSNYVLNELKRLGVASSDLFNKSVADSTNNLLDIGSHYEATPERWRLFRNGSRLFYQYNTVPEYDHPNDLHLISPSAGDTVTFQSAEKARYTVQYELAVTWAFKLNQALQSGDRLRVGFFNDNDGWFLEQNDTHSTGEADFVVRRDGSETERVTNQSLSIDTTTFARLRLQTAWYRISRQLWDQSYPVDGCQQNNEVARTGKETLDGPSTGNLPLRFEITAGSGTSNLELHAGSVAAVIKGDANTIARTKNVRETVSVGTTGTYVPVYGLRKDPDREVVRVEFTNTDVPKFSGSGDVFVLTIAADESKVLDSNGNQLTDSNWSAPAELSTRNSVLEETTDIAEFPDSTGATTTSAANPGGYQLGLGTRYTSGSGGKIQTTGTDVSGKRVLADGDVAVVLAKAEATGDIDIEFSVEQDF